MTLLEVRLIGRRILLTTIRAFLGVLLLSDVSFRATYREVQDFPVQGSGLIPMNESLVQDPDFPYYGTSMFSFHFPAMMSYSHPVTPLNCSGPACRSFFFSGPLSVAKFPPDARPITKNDSPDATAFIQKNAPGYQMEFVSFKDGSGGSFAVGDCRVLGVPFCAVQICVRKNENSSFIAGIFSNI